MEHTVKKFDNELEHLRAEVLKMGGLVEEQINNALNAFIEGNLELANEVETNDHKVNLMEVNIDEEVSSVIARRQPAAGDLRMLMMVVKTITDLERIGDEATKIARNAKLFQREDHRIKLPRGEQIRHMANTTVGMLRTALDAFARLDLGATGDVVREDEKVDESFKGVLRQLITFMMEDPRTISSAIETLFIAKAIERIGDHAKNISEYVVYMVKGKDVRHLAPEEKEQVALG